MAAPCTCPGGQHDGRFPYCSGTSGGPIVIERGGTDWAQIIDPRDARVAALEAQVQELRRQITIKDESAHLRNLQLDALHAVWCTGGCVTGVHRYPSTEHCGKELTPDLVHEAIAQVKRMAMRCPEGAEWKNIDGLALLDTALAEVARLEALIVAWSKEFTEGHPTNALRAEAARIRARKP